jgi:glycosyltransferase involved in cell wall biosynthesis
LALDPSFRLTIVGKGEAAGEVMSLAAKDDNLSYIPEARAQQLANLTMSADAFWVPGRVGLVAVDAMAVGLPVHTTREARHAPEIEFLHPQDLAYLGPTPEAFAESSLGLIGTRGRARVLREDYPTVDRVAANMERVILDVLAR